MSWPETIAVDVDDVLAANAEGFVDYSNRRWGTNLTVQDYQEGWSEMWQIDHDETERRADEFHNSGVISTYRHFPEAVEVLRGLSQHFRLVVVTSRRQQIRSDTEDWLDKYFPDIFDGVYLSGIFDTKIQDSSYAKTKRDILVDTRASYLIDDQLKHCQAAAEAGIKSVLFGDYPWNQAEELPEGITRCNNWRTVLGYFHGRG